jgi:hypothetical protein
MSTNATSLIDWAFSTNNINTVNLINNAIGLFFSLLIFIKSYDFEACLQSVRNKREAKRKEKEKAKLLKFKRLLELAKSGVELDINNINLSDEGKGGRGLESGSSNEESKSHPDVVMRVARKKKREIV